MDEGRGRVGEPCVGDGLAAGEDDDGRHAGISDGLDERALRTDQGEVVYIDVFTGAKESMWSQGLMDNVLGGDIVAGTKTLFHSRCIQALPELVLISRPGSHNDDGNIGLLGCFNGRGESGLVVAPALTSLSIVDLSV